MNMTSMVLPFVDLNDCKISFEQCLCLSSIENSYTRKYFLVLIFFVSVGAKSLGPSLIPCINLQTAVTK